ncbi:T9SS type A sorting domain-containing protein [Aquimarina mytili]|uniref:T9SS type A sorting domain-containing protein n=1 Tax=Aquimarina mytili TaxID=874423 RepID=A0A936ZRT0_9FLAO|nr:T9SS type A sorting domain-containing protein [Aquimarina mytili]MBL0683523.1 T9SS type A sorting domain-containing protein [Aquimarina mytili]
MKLKITLIAFFSYALLFSQSFLEVQLPTPDKLSPLFIGPLVKSTIHYGVTPSNYNGKVIVFNHGYIDLNQGQFLFDNSFYQDTYNQGYQAVFVATTRGKGIWINGQLLAESIDIITEKFNVPKVYLVGHSNGGKASEAAMFQYGKRDKVERAFALGTPFWGTYLADISQMPWLNWAWRLTGLNEGARTSTTYYCRDVVRPILDNHPDNEPGKFVILGASGFYKGSTIAAPAFLLTGGILFAAQGVNDGVAPYSSTLRPGAEYVFTKNDSRAIFDHLDVGLGQFSWSYIKSYIENPTLRSNVSFKKSSNSSKIESNYYIIHSDNEYEQILLDQNSSYAIAEIIHEKPDAQFEIFDQANKKVNGQKSHREKEYQTVIPITNTKLKLKSDSRFAAFIKQNNGIKMSLEHIQKGKSQVLKVDISSNDNTKILDTKTEVRGVIMRTATLDGKKLEESPGIVTFDYKNDSYYFDTSSLEEGVYSLFLNSESKNNFKRSLISGFVVGDIQKDLNGIEINDQRRNLKKSMTITPNAVKNEAKISFTGYQLPKDLTINIYDITGKQIQNFNVKTNQKSQFDISNHIKTLDKGIYLIRANKFETLRFIKK